MMAENGDTLPCLNKSLSSSANVQWLILGNPENRRIDFFQAALKRFGFKAAQVISYEQFIVDSSLLLKQLSPETILRIESPGENYPVEKLLIYQGAKLHKTLNQDKIQTQAIEFGQIYFPNLFYLGFKSVLEPLLAVQPIAAQEKDKKQAVILNPVNDIMVMFDKSLCRQLLHGRQVNTPRVLENIRSYDELISVMEAKKISRVFVKLRHASSASGCIALAVNRKQQKQVAYSTIEINKKKQQCFLFNSLKPRVYKDNKTIQLIIDTLAQFEVHVEQWVPKGNYKGYSYDLRVMVIGHSVKHSVARLSKQPITNLHLGNLRSNISDLSLSSKALQEINDLAIDAAQCFHNSCYLGIDIALPDNSKPVVIEVNAFGDLLPDLAFQGLDTYETEVKFVQQLLS